MLNRVINGFTIIAHEFKPLDACYVILGQRRTSAGSYEYVTAKVRNIDTDTEWFYGNYFQGNAEALGDALVDMLQR